MKKIFLLFLVCFVIQNICVAKDIIQFDFPNNGWHQVTSPDGIKNKKCFVPLNQTSENYTEMLIFSEKVLKHTDISPMSMLHKQLGKDRNNYIDITPEYIVKDLDNAMAAWCSKYKNTCAIQRAFKGNEGIIFATYINKAPHYSQNMFGQWSNILSSIEVNNNEKTTKSLIEL